MNKFIIFAFLAMTSLMTTVRFQVVTGKPTQQRTGIAIVAVYGDGELGAAARAIDAATGGLVSDVLDSGDLQGNPGQTLMLTGTSGLPVDRILLVGCGKKGSLDRKSYRKAIRSALSAVCGTAHTQAISYIGPPRPYGSYTERPNGRADCLRGNGRAVG